MNGVVDVPENVSADKVIREGKYCSEEQAHRQWNIHQHREQRINLADRRSRLSFSASSGARKMSVGAKHRRPSGVGMVVVVYYLPPPSRGRDSANVSKSSGISWTPAETSRSSDCGGQFCGWSIIGAG